MPQLPNDDDLQETPYDADGNPVGDTPGTTSDPEEDDTPDGGMDIEENEDGSVSVTIKGEKSKPESKDFYENLAEDLIPYADLRQRAAKLLDEVERDREAREERDKQYEEGIKRTGLGNEAPGGANFSGASKVVHPVLIEGCIDFSARAMKEICPPQGPVRTKIMGKSTPDKVDKAERKRQFMNWQLTKKIEEYVPETEKMLTQLPMGGSQYKKWWYDSARKRPAMEFVPIDNVFLPFAATSFYTAERITHWQKITEDKFNERVESGFYRELPNLGTPGMTEESRSQQATDKIEGRQDVGFNQDGTRDIYEVSYYDEFEDDDRADGRAPYIMHIDKISGECLALYRNWDEDDEQKERLHWMVESVYIPWRGIYGLGLPHIIGSLSGAITGSIRAILDNALAQTRMGGVKLKGARASGTSVSSNPSEFTELDSGVAGGQDDVRKMVMYQPINQQSPILFNVVQWLVEQAKGVVAVADEKIGDATSEMPMGTALALIEQGSITFSQIHARLHHSQMRELEVLHRLNRWYLSDEEVIEELGDLVISKSDFEGPMDVIPVSDPNIFSESQRYAQLQAVIGLMNNPILLPMFKPDQVLDRALQLMNVANREELLNIKPEPEELDAVSENMMVGLQEQPIKPFMKQDHIAHAKVHLGYITSPLFGAAPTAKPETVLPLWDHVEQHMVMLYVKHMNAAKSVVRQVGMPAENADQEFAAAMESVNLKLTQDMADLQQPMQAAQQIVQKMQQSAQQAQQAQNPAAAAMADVQRKQQFDQQENARKEKEVQFNQQFQTQQHKDNMAQADKKLQADQTLQQLIQQQKDDREKQEQMFKNMREDKALEQEGHKALLQSHTDIVTTQIKAHVDGQIKAHSDKLDHLHNLINTHLEHQRETENLRQQRETAEKQEKEKAAEKEQKMAEGGGVKGKTPTVQMDPEHTKAIQDLVKHISYTQRAHELNPPKDNGAELAKTLTVALAQMGQHFEKLSQAQQQQNQQLMQNMTAAVEKALAETRSDLKSVAAATDATHKAHQTVAGAFDQLNATMRAPRKRVLTKDKKGNKSVRDEIDEGDE